METNHHSTRLNFADLRRSFRQPPDRRRRLRAHRRQAGTQEAAEGLEDELNRYLASEYGVKVSDKAAYAKWVKSHQPFHWFVEFYGIVSSGGFDVIIGNPPYVASAKVRIQYSIKSIVTLSCPATYTRSCVERSLVLLTPCARFGMILPISFQFGSEFESARKVCKQKLSKFGSRYFP